MWRLRSSVASRSSTTKPRYIAARLWLERIMIEDFVYLRRLLTREDSFDNILHFGFSLYGTNFLVVAGGKR